ncbi:MAG: hypothetical protein BZY88_01065 [SAR202 cluster bacterium Io17-Chloro-G9]|nr:MAG: hypothetical protein BZY88_01065 [SAR202 cluster bacterium Io17-Chloro-G9]
MPEALDLEIIKDFLNDRVKDRTVLGATVLRPTVLRSLAGDFPADVAGRTLGPTKRMGKFLLIELSDDRRLVINPMLTGALQFCPSSQRVLKKTCVILDLGQCEQLRYLDDRQMGKVYYMREEQTEQVPRLMEQGPDVLDGITFEDFQSRLKPFRGELKGVLTRGAFISGIGNAYADEILFSSGLSPFIKTRALSQADLRRLYEQCPLVVEEAMDVLRRRMGDAIHVKIRDFLQVHNKGGQPCPHCGGNITQLTANQRITSYCRKCQPGMLIRN